MDAQRSSSQALVFVSLVVEVMIMALVDQMAGRPGDSGNHTLR
jgi:hypothetical protein